MKIYVAGPMRGYDNLNYPAFDRAAAYLRGQGHRVRSPAENDRKYGITSQNVESYESLLPRLFRWDIEAVLWADVIAMLDGWERSAGATIETSVAKAIGTPFRHWQDISFMREENYVASI